MTLRHLEIFQIVCAQMSITKAADELNMTQPAVSIAVKESVSYTHLMFKLRAMCEEMPLRTEYARASQEEL